MTRMFLGMIIGSMMTMFAADGTATAERIMEKAYHAASAPGAFTDPAYWVLATMWLGVMVGTMVWRHWTPKTQKVKTHYLL